MLSHVKCFNFQAMWCPPKHQLVAAIRQEYWLLLRDSFVSAQLSVKGEIQRTLVLRGREIKPDRKPGHALAKSAPSLLSPLGKQADLRICKMIFNNYFSKAPESPCPLWDSSGKDLPQSEVASLCILHQLLAATNITQHRDLAIRSSRGQPSQKPWEVGSPESKHRAGRPVKFLRTIEDGCIVPNSLHFSLCNGTSRCKPSFLHPLNGSEGGTGTEWDRVTVTPHVPSPP